MRERLLPFLPLAVCRRAVHADLTTMMRPRSPDGIQQVGHAKYAQNNSHDPDCFDVEKALSIRWHDETILAGRRSRCWPSRLFIISMCGAGAESRHRG